MLASVSNALGYENLGGGYKQPTNSITSIPSRDGGVRQPLGLPNGAVPGITGPIRNTTARPGKQTNQRITYTRVQTQFAKDCAHIDRVPVQEGDAVFVHRVDGSFTPGLAIGNDTARTSRVASITQLNVVLNSGGVNTAGEITMAPDKNPRGETVPETSDNPVWDRWANCKMLARWTPDGVLAGKEHDCVAGESNPGEAYNIAIGGPQLMRNSPAGDYPQHFDDGVRLLDKVFVGLIASENREYNAATDTYGANMYWSYKYKLFTSRQLSWAPLGAANIQIKDQEMNAPGGVNTLAPTVSDFARMVSVWRIGSVVDTKSGMLPYKCVTLNVVIEPWSLDMIQAEFNPYFGESLALAKGIFATVAAMLQEAVATITRLRVLLDAEPVLKTEAAYSSSLPSEYAAWEQTDRAWEEDVGLANIRGAPPPPAPGTTAPPSAQHGPVLGGRRYYAPASGAMQKFWTEYQTISNATKLEFTNAGIEAMAALGRTSALAGNAELMKWVDKNGQREAVESSVAINARVTKLRSVMRLGARIAERVTVATDAGTPWVLA